MLKKNRFILLSILAHVILIFIVARSMVFSSKPTPETTNVKPIQARIIFDIAPRAIVKEPPVAEPLPVAAEKPSSKLDTQAGPPPKKVKRVTETEKPSPIAAEPVIETPPAKKELPPQPEETKPAISSSTESPTQSINSPEAKVSKPVTSMARRHLGSFQQQQRQRMAEQASRGYQESKNSPFINTEEKDPFMTEDEKLRDSLKVRADCSNTTKKTSALLLGFLGGNIDCSKPPPIDGYIQKRLNKTQDLPRQSATQKSQSDLTKSIVVQDR